LTGQQKELYDAVVNRQLRSFLIELKTGFGSGTATPTTESDGALTDGSIASRPKRRAAKAKRRYTEISDSQYFKECASGTATEVSDAETASVDLGRDHVTKTAREFRLLPSGMWVLMR